MTWYPTNKHYQRNQPKTKNDTYPIPITSTKEVQRFLQHVQNTDTDNYLMQMNNPEKLLEIAVIEVEYIKLMKLNWDLDMKSFNCLPPVQDLLQVMELLDRLATKQAKQ